MTDFKDLRNEAEKAIDKGKTWRHRAIDFSTSHPKAMVIIVGILVLAIIVAAVR